MGYFTYRLFQSVSLNKLRKKAEANLALYEPRTVGRQLELTIIEGDGCSAMLLGYRLNEPSIFEPIGFQFGCIWMDVRYQDGDWWDLSVYQGTEHRCSHNINPWANELRHRYNQDHIDYRIGRVRELWPEQSGRIERYLLPWREPVTRSGTTRFVPRKGKAYETDEYGYGNADQIHDFVGAFGIDRNSRKAVVGYPGRRRLKQRNRPPKRG